VLPYRVDMAFGGTHPVSAALPSGSEPLRPYPNTTDVGWSSNSISGRQQDGKVAFGEIRGLLLVGDDGQVSGSAVFSYEHGPRWNQVDDGGIAGHALECPSTSYQDTSRLAKVFRWDVPIVVRGSLVPGTEDDPELDLTFSFGFGATEDEAGVLPEPTVARDTLGSCKPTLDSGIGTVADPYRDHDTSYEVIAGYPPRFTRHATHDADDPAVTLVIQHPDTRRPSQL